MKEFKGIKCYASALILAAGESRRMGQPKFSLRFDEDTTFIEHIVKQYHEFGCNDIVIVLNPQGVSIFQKDFSGLHMKARTLQNDFPERGRFYSIKLGLGGCNGLCPVFIHNADNPFIDKEVLTNLLAELNHSDYAFPLYRGKGGHPVAINRKVVESILAEPSDDFNLKVFLSRFQKSTVRLNDGRMVVNINTPEDYQRIMSSRHDYS